MPLDLPRQSLCFDICIILDWHIEIHKLVIYMLPRSLTSASCAKKESESPEKCTIFASHSL